MAQALPPGAERLLQQEVGPSQQPVPCQDAHAVSVWWGSNLIHTFPPGQGFSTWTCPAGAAVSTGALGGCPGGLRYADPLLPTELLSAENGSACSPRLSPDGQRLLYLEGVVGGPHRQCLRLLMVSWASRAPGAAVPPCAASTVPSPGVTASRSAWLGVSPNLPASVSPGMGPSLTTGSPQLTWQTRQTVTVLDVVQEPTEGEQGMVGRAGF